MQVDRQTEVGKTGVQIYLQTNGNKDIQTYTDKQTDRCTERPIFTHTVHTNSSVHKTDIQTDRQTDRTDRKE